MKSLNFKGKWWVPGKEEEKISGELKFDPYKPPRLNLDDVFELLKKEKKSSPEIIHGVSREKGRVTFYNSEFLGRDMDFKPGLYMESSNFVANMVLIGDHVKSKPLIINHMKLSFPYLSDWLNKEVFEIERNTNDKEINIKLDDFCERIQIDDFEVEFQKKATGQHTLGKKITVKVQPSITIKTENESNIEKYLGISEKIRDLLSLMTGKDIDPTYVKVFKKNEKDQEDPTEQQSIDVYFPINNYHKTERDLAVPQMLLSYRSIENNFSEVWKNWFEKRDEFRWEIDYYFGVRSSDSMYENNKMLNLVQAIESYHGSKEDFDDKYMDEDFDDIKNNLFDCLPDYIDEKVEQNMKTLIGFSNTFTLKDRLLDIYNRYEDLFGPFNIDEDLLDDIKKTRDHFTHLSKEEEEIMTWEQIAKSVPKLRLMMEICLLKELGVDEKTIKRGLKNYTNITLNLKDIT